MAQCPEALAACSSPPTPCTLTLLHPRWGRRLAQRLKAPFVLLEGAHFLTRDQAVAVNQLIKGVVFGNVRS